jgi:hypothetical protein
VEQLAGVEKSFFELSFPDSYTFMKGFGLLQKRFN